MNDARLDQTLREVFGFEQLRQGQRRVVEALMAGRSALAVFPTGAGKSLCYQLPALLLDGLTVVVSPLIALMKDQIDFLLSRDVRAARLDSSLGFEETKQVYDGLSSGELRILYVAPERFGNERFIRRLAGRKIALMAVDEAHCISEWGHNFRPDYLKLARFAEQLDAERVLALTATATPEVVADICKEFGIAGGDAVNTGFHRENLFLRVVPCAAETKMHVLLERLREREPGPAIVYVTLQKTAEEVAEQLNSVACEAKAYHAGMENETRRLVQDWFMASDNAIVVATIAFGMGIDKANIRQVYHYNLPKSLENYSQEIGRAGRDGAPSTCEMLVSPDDALALENFAYGDTPTREAVAGCVDEILAQGPVFDVSYHELSRRHDMRLLVVATLLTYLEIGGVLRATAPFYSAYRFRPRRPGREIIAAFEGERRQFMTALFAQCRKARTWVHLDVHAASLALEQPRERLVAALNFLEERGEITLQTSGIRHGYRKLDTARSRDELVQDLIERFEAAERREIGRVAQVLSLARHEGCITRELLGYFGETLAAACGHCDRCAGEERPAWPEQDPPPLDSEDEQVIAAVREENHAALASPRQLARFLCGLTSPATVSARPRLTADARFGAFAHISFRKVLDYLETRADGSGSKP